MTHARTTLGKSLEDHWVREGLPVSTPLDAAMVTAGVLVDDSLHGTSMYVARSRMGY